MPEARIVSSSSSDSPFQLLLRQRLVVRGLIQAHKAIGIFNPTLVGRTAPWETVVKGIHPPAGNDRPIAGLGNLSKSLQHEFLMECGQATARFAHTQPMSPELFGVKTPADYLLPGLYANRHDVTRAAISFPSAYPDGIQAAGFWQDFWRRYLEAMGYEFWVWFVRQKPISMTNRDVWRAFGKAARQVHAEWAQRLKIKKIVWRAAPEEPTPEALRQTLQHCYKRHRVTSQLVDGWLYHQAFNQFLIDLGEIRVSTAEYITLLDQFMASAIPGDVEERLLNDLAPSPIVHDVVLDIRVRSPLDPLGVSTRHLPFSFKKVVFPRRKHQIQAVSKDAVLAHFPHVPLQHGSDAAGACIPMVRQFMDQIAYLSQRGIDWQVVSVSYRPKSSARNVGWGWQRFDSPRTVDMGKIYPGIKLFSKIMKRGDDVGQRCERALKYWAQAHLSVLDDEGSFLNLWAIVDIINTKAASEKALALIMPIYWLQQKFPNETPAILEQEYNKVKEYFSTLWDIRSHGVIHRQRPNWEPRALAIWTTVLRDYLATALAALFHHLLNCKKCKKPSVDILSVIRCMMDSACAAGLPVTYRAELLKRVL